MMFRLASIVWRMGDRLRRLGDSIHDNAISADLQRKKGS